MADNVNLPLTGAGGTTATVASEDIGGVQYQRVKLVEGAVGSTVVGSSAVLGTVNVSSGVQLGLGTSATYQFIQTIPFSTGTIARTSVSTTVDISIVAANANRKALIIANASTAQIVALGLSTGAVSTAKANANLYLAPVGSAGSHLVFGSGGLPLYTGPVRGINISSTTVAGGVNVTEWT